jgi:hypothetical protein
MRGGVGVTWAEERETVMGIGQSLLVTELDFRLRDD